MEYRARRSWQFCLGSLFGALVTGGLLLMVSTITSGWGKYTLGGLLVLFFFASLVSAYVGLTADMILAKRRSRINHAAETTKRPE